MELTSGFPDILAEITDILDGQVYGNWQDQTITFFQPFFVLLYKFFLSAALK